jgi:hypothetical protein
MIVKRNGDATSPSDQYKLYYTVTSPAFKSSFGTGRIVVSLSDDHVLMQRASPLVTFWEGEIRLRANGTVHVFRFFGYETPYNIFILLAPKTAVRAYGSAKVVLMA